MILVRAQPNASFGLSFGWSFARDVPCGVHHGKRNRKQEREIRCSLPLPPYLRDSPPPPPPKALSIVLDGLGYSETCYLVLLCIFNMVEIPAVAWTRHSLCVVYALSVTQDWKRIPFSGGQGIAVLGTRYHACMHACFIGT